MMMASTSHIPVLQMTPNKGGMVSVTWQPFIKQLKVNTSFNLQ